MLLMFVRAYAAATPQDLIYHPHHKSTASLDGNVI